MPLIVDHDERRCAYARAAWSVIADHGLVGTTMRDLAAAAGVTTGALTHYFDSKQQLVEHALEQLASDTLERTALVGAKTPDEVAELILLALPLDAAGRIEWKTWIALWSECARGDRAAIALNGDFEKRWFGVLGDALAEAGSTNPAEAADRLALTINGLGIDACLNPNRWPAKKLRTFAAELARQAVA